MEFKDYLLKKMEEKLIELMGKEAYTEFSVQIAREGFRKEVDGMADGDFKNFVIENFDKITQ